MKARKKNSISTTEQELTMQSFNAPGSFNSGNCGKQSLEEKKKKNEELEKDQLLHSMPPTLCSAHSLSLCESQ